MIKSQEQTVTVRAPNYERNDYVKGQGYILEEGRDFGDNTHYIDIVCAGH